MPFSASNSALLARFQAARAWSETLVSPLQTEDYVAQPMPDTSPTKWHLAHVTWFWETFLLKPHLPGYQALFPEYEILFNSYYNAVGPQFPRATARRHHAPDRRANLRLPPSCRCRDGRTFKLNRR